MFVLKVVGDRPLHSESRWERAACKERIFFCKNVNYLVNAWDVACRHFHSERREITSPLLPDISQLLPEMKFLIFYPSHFPADRISVLNSSWTESSIVFVHSRRTTRTEQVELIFYKSLHVATIEKFAFAFYLFNTSLRRVSASCECSTFSHLKAGSSLRRSNEDFNINETP